MNSTENVAEDRFNMTKGVMGAFAGAALGVVVMFALRSFEMGHPAFAALAISRALALSAPGILALTSRCDSVTPKPPSILSSVTVAVVWIDSGVSPALPSSAEKAIEKQPACAA